MHRGNVLVRRTHEEYIYFRLDGVEYSIKSYGAVATIVDYTLSRVKQGTWLNVSREMHYFNAAIP